MDHGSAADSRLRRSASLVDSASMRSFCNRWKPSETQKRILNSKFAGGTRNPSVEEINRITAELQRHGPVEGRNVFYWFHNANTREKRRKEKAEKEKAESSSSSKWPSVFKARNWTSLFRAKKSSDRKRSAQMEEEEEEVDSGPRRNSSVDPSDMRTLELFPLHPGL